MKTPLAPLLARLDSDALLDRGGRPTLREFIAGLAFDPNEGKLLLNGRRMVLQSAEADRLLHRALGRTLGEEEARIFLLRHGYRLGLADAAFVEANWSGVDRGDAFTAGTRLHMFSGIVRVETLHNDFDFARGRFSGEFLWHHSIAAEGANGSPFAELGQCWQQIGYASGYASHFFGALVVYKEAACAAQGHRACRVVGRLAEAWGEDDPDVMLFRQNILPFDRVKPRREPPRKAPVTKAPILEPIAQRLESMVSLQLPWLIAGEGNQGQGEAALAFCERLSLPREAVLQWDGAQIAPQDFGQLLAQGRKPRKTVERQLLWIDRPEAMTPGLQGQLTWFLRQDLGSLQIILTSYQPLARLSSRELSRALWSRLAATASEMPKLSNRADREAILAERSAFLARQMGQVLQDSDAVELPEAAFCDLDRLEGAITALLLAKLEGRRVEFATEAQGADLDLEAFESAMKEGRFSLPEHEADLRRRALALAGGNLSAAARFLGISRAQLAYRETAKG